jgi:hypothetical protein
MKILIEISVKHFWETGISKSYLEAEKVYKKLQITNNLTERGVALI